MCALNVIPALRGIQSPSRGYPFFKGCKGDYAPNPLAPCGRDKSEVIEPFALSPSRGERAPATGPAFFLYTGQHRVV
jgi:hypothetical protein